MMYRSLFKPLFDRLGALLLLTLLSPLLLVLILLIRIKLGSPILFKQERPGKDEKPFTIYKFRTMNDQKDSKGELLPDEERLTPLGKFIRSLSLDELPQLLNVLKGEMSFIGPRPLLTEYLPLYNETQKKRHKVTPGITGWAQVNGRNAITWEKKFELDVYYVEHISWKLDLKIIMMTLQKIIRRSDISQEGHATVEKFNANN